MNRKDILGNEIKSECVGCAIVRGEVKLPGGIQEIHRKRGQI